MEEIEKLSSTVVVYSVAGLLLLLSNLSTNFAGVTSMGRWEGE